MITGIFGPNIRFFDDLFLKVITSLLSVDFTPYISVTKWDPLAGFSEHILYSIMRYGQK